MCIINNILKNSLLKRIKTFIGKKYNKNVKFK